MLLTVSFTACRNQQLPTSITIDASAPLNCTLLEEPKVIEDQTALYSCAAPGAYVAEIDTDAMTATYFTTDSQGTTITYGPVTIPVLEFDP